MDNPAELIKLTRTMYNNSSQTWDQSRQSAWPGWEKLWEQFTFSGNKLKCLDLGCGNGRFLKFLTSKTAVDYLGIDFSEELLKIAKMEAQKSRKVFPENQINFRNLDLTDNKTLDLFLKKENQLFDLVVIFAVLQHLPTFEQRLNLLKTAKKFLKTGGMICITTWNFLALANIEQKIVKKITDQDYLLSFAAQESPRYLHSFSSEEITELISQAELKVVTSFDSDGRNGQLNKYQILI